MSIGNPGIIGAFATQPLAQTQQSKAQGQAAADHARAIDSATRAADSAGIGRTGAEEPTSDRDADGRRLLERTADQPKSDDDSDESDPPRQSRDASGHSGTQIDLSG